MELAGIEPASKSPSVKTSPITVCVLTFPHTCARRRAKAPGSFMNFPQSQSFENGVSHFFDAGVRVVGLPLLAAAGLSSS